MQVLETLKTQIVHTIGRTIDDSAMKRKKYDFEYKQRRKRIKCTFTPEEFKKIRKEADKAGLKASVYLKQACFALQTNKPLHSQELQESFNQTMPLLRNVANNINQIAHRVNTVKKVAFGDLLKTKKQVHELEKIIEQAFNSA